MKRFCILFVVLCLGITTSIKAQIDPLAAQYFNNRYLGNPAMAGVNQGYTVNGVYRQLFESFPGGPVSQSLSADYGFDKIGLGVNIFNDRAGLIRQTRAVGSFSYHLPLSGNGERLSFGISLGILNQRLSQGAIIGASGDILVVNYNSRFVYFDGDFGAAYSGDGLIIQTSAPNLRNLFKRDYAVQSDVPTFYAAASYKINLEKSGFSFEPLVAYRNFTQIKGIIDVGAQFYLVNDQVFLTGLYHNNSNNNNSATIGLGMNFKKHYLISGMYTTGTSNLSGYSNGNFELSLRYAVWK